MRHALFLCLFLLTIPPADILAQDRSEWFPFTLPWDDSTRSGDAMRFFPRFPEQDAGRLGFLKAESGGFFTFDDGKPVRFVGVNFSFGASMPDSATALKIALRLAKYGVNVVRMHHMDNYAWRDERETILDIPSNGSDTRHLNPTQLDRMGFFIHALAEQGIYTNLNMHVSRRFQSADGVMNADSLPMYGKIVSIFDPRIRFLMREYARNLLGSVNRHTGLRFADDPRIAFVEISNENSLYGAWKYGALNGLMRSEWDLSFAHRRMLDSLWHVWLRARYVNTDEIRAAWQSRSGSPPVNSIVNGSFETPLDQEWGLEVHRYAGADAVVTRDTGGVDGIYAGRVATHAVTGTSWHIQFKQVGTVRIEADSQYTLSFSARASHPLPISVGCSKDISGYDSYGLARNVELSNDWRRYSLSFRATSTDSQHTRISFIVGQDTGSVWFDNIRFTSLDQPGLEDQESLEAGTIRMISGTEAEDVTPERLRENAAFIIGTQKGFFDEMRSFLRDSIGVRCPISGTNWYFGLGDLYAQKEMDYIDAHAYWEHPEFPNIPWDPVDWRIPNRPMSGDSALGTIPSLAAHAVAGKPFVVSEYNHPAPNRYQSEMPLHLAAYASLQDWSGFYIYSYHHSHRNWDHGKINGFFDVDGNPIVMAQLPQMSQIFHENLLRPAQRQVDLEFGKLDLLEEFTKKEGKIFFTGLPDGVPLIYRTRVHDFEAARTPEPASYGIGSVSAPYISDTREIHWNPSELLLTVESPRARGVTGILPASPIFVGDAEIRGEDRFVSLLWTSLDGNDLAVSQRSLLTIMGRAENTGMIWDGDHTVHDNWGNTPVLCEPHRIQITFTGVDTLRLYPLDSLGRASASHIFHAGPDGRLSIIIDQKMLKSPWFGLERTMKSTGQVADNRAIGDVEMELYPHPVRDESVLRIHFPGESFVRIALYDRLGRRIRTSIQGSTERGWTILRLKKGTLPTGNYLLRITTGTGFITRLITIL